MQVINPFDQTVITDIDVYSEKKAYEKVLKAHDLFRNSNNWLTKIKRRDVLEKLKGILISKRDLIIDTAVSEGGKPYKDTVVEFDRGISGIDIALWEIFNLKGDVISMELNEASMHRHAYTIKEPRGVVLAISAFNHPFNLIIHQVIPCIATSCPVLIKPASKTPLSCKIIVESIYQAGLDPLWCQYLPIENDVCESLLACDEIAFMSFIGSAKVGWHLRSKLAPGTHCALEHGGIAPVIIDRNVDFKEIVSKLVKSSFYHAGQVCVSTQRIFVATESADEFLEEFKAATARLKVLDPKNKDSDVGPLIRPAELKRIETWVSESLDHGARLVIGGQQVHKTCYEPTIIFNPRPDDKISTEEIFGPVVAIYPYTHLADAIARANDTKYFFQAAIFTNDVDNAFFAARTLQGRCVLINDHSAFRVDWMPFGGHRYSGLGVSGIGYSMTDLSIDKLLIFNFKSM